VRSTIAFGSLRFIAASTFEISFRASVIIMPPALKSGDSGLILHFTRRRLAVQSGYDVDRSLTIEPKEIESRAWLSV
jgi:hypothetical protein